MSENEVASVTARFKGNLDGLESGVNKAKSLLGGLKNTNFGGAITKGAVNAGRSLLDLARNAFYVKEAFGGIVKVARLLGNVFLRPAMTLQKQQFALESVLGSAAKANEMMGALSDTAQRFGLDLAGIQEQALTLSVISDGDVQLANQYAQAIARVQTLRPDLPGQRQMGVVFALREGDFARASMLLDIPKEKLQALAGISQETAAEVSDAVGSIGAGGEQMLGRFTSIVREAEGAGACGKNLSKEIKKGLSANQINALLSGLGASDQMMEKVGTSMIGNLQKLQNHWLEFRQTVGLKVLDALAGPLDNLLTWIEDNEVAVTGLAEKFGEFIAGGLQKLIDWSGGDGPGKLAGAFMQVAGAVQGLVEAFLGMPPWAQKLLIGGALAMGPLKGGRLVGGLGKMALGKLLGGGAAAAGAAGAGGTAAGAGGTAVAAGAGGLSALGVGGVVAGGAGLGLAVNELISRTEFGRQIGAQSTKTWASVGAYGAGKLFGGEELGREWFSKMAGIPMQEPQQFEVKVTVDDEMRLSAQVDRRIGRNNDDVMNGWGITRPSFGGVVP